MVVRRMATAATLTMLGQATMTRAIVCICTFILSSAGWYAGSQVGIFTAFVVSMIGTGVGMYAGKQLAERWGG